MLATAALLATGIIVLFFYFSLNVFQRKYKGSPQLYTKNRKYLPGPPIWPVFGSILHIAFTVTDFMHKPSYEVLLMLTKKWGSPMALQVGRHYSVIIDDINTAKKIMNSEDWSHRANDDPLLYRRSFNQHLGLLFSNGEGWKEMRRFVNKSLTKFGFGRTKSMELNHEDEIKHFFTFLDEKREMNEDIVNMGGIFRVSALNILWNMVGSVRFDYESQEILRPIHLLEEFAAALHPKELSFIAFPWLRFIPGATSYNMMMENHKKMQDFFRKIIYERKATGAYKERQENLMDNFLYEIDNHKEKNIQPNYYTEQQFIMVLLDLFLTGFLPVASCLEYLLMFMMLNPEIQKKCQDEIDLIIGKNQFPSINDNEKMPYTQAVCIEALRRVTFIPMTSRTACKDTTINGCFIPKDTIANFNLYEIHNNSEMWQNPEEFRPERFLDANGKLCNQDAILAFGIGKRVCPAEILARISTFTYFVYLLQRYTFEIPPQSSRPDPTPISGMGNKPKPFHALIKLRLK